LRLNLNNGGDGVAHGTLIIDLIVVRGFGGQKFVGGWRGRGSGLLIAFNGVDAFCRVRLAMLLASLGSKLESWSAF
jgi:hypothetical protein